MTFSNHRPRSGQYTVRALSAAHESCFAACKQILDQIAARHDALSRKIKDVELEPRAPVRDAQLRSCMEEFQKINELCAEAIVKCEEALGADSVDTEIARARLRAIRSRLSRVH
jgi:hypothetical protein